MTEDQFRQMRTLILDLKCEVSELKLAVRTMQRRQDDIVGALEPQFTAMPTSEEVKAMMAPFFAKLDAAGFEDDDGPGDAPARKR